MALALAVAVARMVGGLKVSEGDTEGVCVRRVSVAATEAETLGQAVWETVGDRERTVSVAAGEGVAGLGLAVARALPVPSPEGLCAALAEAEAVSDTLPEDEAVAEGERVAVEESERMVIVAGTETETVGQAVWDTEPLPETEALRVGEGVAVPLAEAEGVAVEVCERTVSVAAGEAVPALGVPVPWLLAVPPGEGLCKALGEAEGLTVVVAVPLPEPAQGEGLCVAQEEALPVAGLVGGMKVSEGDTVGECERMVIVGNTEAETLGQAVWETVADCERAVSVTAGEAVPALGLAVARALPVPPTGPVALGRALGEAQGEARVVGLSRALGETVGVLRVVGGMKEKEGVKEAVVVCERSVSVGSTVVEREAVEDRERTVSVAAGEAEPAAGLPVRSGLPVAARVGLSVALGQLLAVEVPEAEARPEVVAQAEEPTEALPEAEEPPEALPEARSEGLLLGVALWQSEYEAEGVSSSTFGTLPEGLRVCEAVAGRLGRPVAVIEGVKEVEMEPLGEPVADLLGEPVAVIEGVKEVEMEPLGEPEADLLGEPVAQEVGVGEERALGLKVRELVLQALGEGVWEDVPQEEGESVPEGLQEEAVTVPGKGQVAVQAQATQVALLEAPMAALAVPAGQSVALKEEKGQYLPAGQMTGPPEAQ
jgi:hypothetical protein